MRKRIAYGAALAVVVLGLTIAALQTRSAIASRTGESSAPVLTGDINHDGTVDVRDVYEASLAFGSRTGEPRWNAEADIDGNGFITLAELYIICSHFGDKIPP